MTKKISRAIAFLLGLLLVAFFATACTKDNDKKEPNAPPSDYTLKVGTFKTDDADIAAFKQFYKDSIFKPILYSYKAQIEDLNVDAANNLNVLADTIEQMTLGQLDYIRMMLEMQNPQAATDLDYLKEAIDMQNSAAILQIKEEIESAIEDGKGENALKIGLVREETNADMAILEAQLHIFQEMYKLQAVQLMKAIVEGLALGEDYTLEDLQQIFELMAAQQGISLDVDWGIYETIDDVWNDKDLVISLLGIEFAEIDLTRYTTPEEFWDDLAYASSIFGLEFVPVDLSNYNSVDEFWADSVYACSVFGIVFTPVDLSQYSTVDEFWADAPNNLIYFGIPQELIDQLTEQLNLIDSFFDKDNVYMEVFDDNKLNLAFPYVDPMTGQFVHGEVYNYSVDNQGQITLSSINSDEETDPLDLPNLRVENDVIYLEYSNPEIDSTVSMEFEMVKASEQKQIESQEQNQFQFLTQGQSQVQSQTLPQLQTQQTELNYFDIAQASKAFQKWKAMA